MKSERKSHGSNPIVFKRIGKSNRYRNTYTGKIMTKEQIVSELNHLESMGVREFVTVI